MKRGHWLFSFILHTCRLGDRVRKGINPFTGEPVEFPIDDGLSEADRKGIQAVFDRYAVGGPEANDEGYALYLPARGSVRFRGGDLDDDELPLVSFSVEIVIQKLSEDVLDLVLEVARKGNLALMSSTGECVCSTKKSTSTKFKRRWPDAGVIGTTEALQAWLEDQIRGWKVHVPGSR